MAYLTLDMIDEKNDVDKEGKYVLPFDVRNIRVSAFVGCRDLKKIVFPAYFQILDGFTRTTEMEGLFKHCPKLQEVVAPMGVCMEAFKFCASPEVKVYVYEQYLPRMQEAYVQFRMKNKDAKTKLQILPYENHKDQDYENMISERSRRISGDEGRDIK